MRLQYIDNAGNRKTGIFTICCLVEGRGRNEINSGYGKDRESARLDLFKNIKEEQKEVNKFFNKLYDFIESKD